MSEKRFTIDVLDENNWLIQDTKTGENANPIDGTTNVLKGLISTLNKFNDENEQLKQQRKELLRLIDNNIEIYENIDTNVEFHQGEIQGKLTLLNNLRKVILND